MLIRDIDASTLFPYNGVKGGNTYGFTTFTVDPFCLAE